MTKAISTLLILLLFLNSYPQHKNKVDYSKIDSFARIQKSNNLDTLTLKLTQPFKTKIEKTRAIYSWITYNIEYDMTEFNKIIGNKNSISLVSNQTLAQKTFVSKKAVCEGFATLFDIMCKKSSIEAEIILGYAKVLSDKTTDTTFEPNHAWNAVKIENKWFLIDATWSSGYCDYNYSKFTKSFNDFYFFVDPAKLINTHFPEDSKWQLLSTQKSFSEFCSTAYVFPRYYDSKIKKITPNSKVLKISKANPIVKVSFEFDNDYTDTENCYLTLVDLTPKMIQQQVIDVPIEWNNLPKIIVENKIAKVTIEKKINTAATQIHIYDFLNSIIQYEIEWIK